MEKGIYRSVVDHDFTVTVTRIMKTQVEFVTAKSRYPKTLKTAVFAQSYELLPAARVIAWDDLIDENAEVKVWALKSMARGYALRTWGEISPRSLRDGLRWVNDRIPMLIERKRRALGLPVAPGVLVDMGIADGFGREA